MCITRAYKAEFGELSIGNLGKTTNIFWLALPWYDAASNAAPHTPVTAHMVFLPRNTANTLSSSSVLPEL